MNTSKTAKLFVKGNFLLTLKNSELYDCFLDPQNISEQIYSFKMFISDGMKMLSIRTMKVFLYLNSVQCLQEFCKGKNHILDSYFHRNYMIQINNQILV